ncbi:CRISPR-associated helicase/endonuclease Cas3 [Kurthia massiliensis]|uniref:CRISPR-associated helicase/endonuclease Cas3 n=1 Tax=Kurthia massiliensis TaxID=1033739 RepID=UPI000287E0FB|nr:CRISPR-associated helicase/endonuclease Cas3 [Kurthia massiliensis]
MYIARIVEDGKGEFREQSLKNHLLGAEQLGKQYGQDIGFDKLTGLTAVLHDLGKYSEDFQVYIREAVYQPEKNVKRGSVPHAFAGGHFLFKNINYDLIDESKEDVERVLECMANAIYSHHGKLKDVVTPNEQSELYLKMIKEIPDYKEIESHFFNEIYDEKYMQEYIAAAVTQFYKGVDKLIDNIYEESNEEADEDELEAYTAFMTKFLFSTVLDADRTNSRCFEENVVEDIEKVDWVMFEKNLDNHLETLQKTAKKNNIMELRKKMSNECYEFGKEKTGIYTLSIPTGGGKTLASLRFAFQHAQKHQKKRIVYVVPFTTIIEQNAREVQSFLPENTVLEHHSNVVELNEDEEKDNVYDPQFIKWKIAKDNWEAPIIFTTMVQFLNTFYDGVARNTRRLHNLENSIVIFDEVQAIPVKCINMFNNALSFMKRTMNTTSILCTATQPALDYVTQSLHIEQEIIKDLPEITKAFKRTEIIPMVKENGWTTDELADFVEDTFSSSMLIILNTKTVTKKLYEVLLEKNLGVELYHLSTNMCAAHRIEIIKQVRENLKNNVHTICVSTQLIEAGVDVSFEAVVRSFAGLDSIAQAAGRCNRHGLQDVGNVYVINHAEENLEKLETILEGSRFSQHILKDIENDATLFDSNALSQKAIKHYFEKFYQKFNSFLDYPTSVGNLHDLLLKKRFINAKIAEKVIGCAAFKTVGNQFKVIDQQTTDILVPYGKGADLIADLTDSAYINDLTQFLKQTQQYTISVYTHTVKQLEKEQLILPVQFGSKNNIKLYILKDLAYNDIFGLDIEAQSIKDNNFMF